MVQVPAPVKLTTLVELLIEHTDEDVLSMVRATVRPEVAVATGV